MARLNEGWTSLGPLRGQNTIDNPLTLGEGWATETRNVVLEPESAVAVKRRGSALLAGAPVATYNLARHLPIGATEENAELWAFTNDSGVLEMYRKVGGAAFAQVVGAPAIVVLRALSFNGKLFLAAITGSAANRMYVWDGTSVRLAGLGAMAAPTVANQGAGTYAALPRFYKTDQIIIDSLGRVAARSELSAEVAFTPSGTGASARVTRAALGAAATHWRVWGSTDNALYRNISGDIVAATTFYDDSVGPSLYTGVFSEPIGTFLPLPAATRLITDGHRLILAGNGSTNATNNAGELVKSTNRVWFTPVLGSLDQGDDERVPVTGDQKNFLDVGDPPSGDVLELDGPMEGQIFVFAKHRPWRLVPTGDLITPYLTYPITSVYGAGEDRLFLQAGSAVGETESGQPAVYFVDEAAGMYRLTSGLDLQFVSADIQNEIDALRPRFKRGTVVFSYPERKQTWWLIGLHTPDEQRIYVFHWRQGSAEGLRVRGGWVTWTFAEPSDKALSAVVRHNAVPGSLTAADIRLVPYATKGVATGIYVFERAAGTDGLTNYAGSVKAAPVVPTGARTQIRVGNPIVIATANPGVSLRVSATRDFGTETRTADFSLTPDLAQTRVVQTVEGLFQGDVTALELTIGDAAAVAALWQVDLATVPVSRQEPR